MGLSSFPQSSRKETSGSASSARSDLRCIVGNFSHVNRRGVRRAEEAESELEVSGGVALLDQVEV
ncbi:hypothetical protein EYF80_059195 [Liparis tanakae]|uniref:Uncharacterized protein n=1 Tax=Liparis tanakae TaxID=230148 RepID=A0A4Z2EQK2_9TELE|nr:hypothetical protein EYF80_059195 [Liparis tanakae]